jgi:hypothetical protein
MAGDHRPGANHFTNGECPPPNDWHFVRQNKVAPVGVLLEMVGGESGFMSPKHRLGEHHFAAG